MQTIKKLPGMGLESETIQGGFCVDTVEHPNPGFYIMKKICTKCKIEKSINEFSKNKSFKDGLSYRCNQCISTFNKQYYQNNSEKLKIAHKKYREESPEKIKIAQKKWRENNLEYDKKYYQKNIEKVKERSKRWSKNNPEKRRNSKKKWRKNNPIKHKKWQNEWFKTKRKNDHIFRLNSNISGAIYKSLKGNKNGYHWEKLVGYSQENLRKHLEDQFKDGMTWGNYGEWVIDHKIPKSLFNIISAKCKGFKKCWALENLQPLWKDENKRKSNKLFS